LFYNNLLDIVGVAPRLALVCLEYAPIAIEMFSV